MEEPDFLIIAKIIKPHGLKGFVEAASLTDFPGRFKPGIRVYSGPHDLSQSQPEFESKAISKVQKDDKATELVLEKAETGGGKLLLKFKGVENRPAAEKLRGHFLQVPLSEAVPLPTSSYWHHQITGLKVFTLTGEFLGEITAIVRTGSNDIYVVSPGEENQKEVLIPATEEVVKEINLEHKKMVIRPLPGLLD